MDKDEGLPAPSAEAARAARAPGPNESDGATEDAPAEGGGEQAESESSSDEATRANEDAPALEEEGSCPAELEPEEASDAADENWTPTNVRPGSYTGRDAPTDRPAPPAASQADEPPRLQQVRR